MKVRQWEVWKARPPGFERDHWFVIISGQERCDAPQHLLVNGLACFTLRGDPRKTEVRLNGADGFTVPTVAQCDFIYSVAKSSLGLRVRVLGAPATTQEQDEGSLALLKPAAPSNTSRV